MNEFFDSLNSRQLSKIVLLVIAIIIAIFKIIVPKVKEKIDRAKAIKSTGGDNGNSYITEGYNALNSGDTEKAVSLFETGMNMGSSDINVYKILMDYYTNINQHYKALHWGRHAIEKHLYDNDIINRMIDVYQLSGEQDKIEELQQILR